MNNKSILLLVLVCSLGCACSPKVTTKIIKNYPPLAPDAFVAVYTNQQDVPTNSETIGTIDITDSGATNKCDSATVFSIALVETRKAGGNGFLVLGHMRPSFFGSSCHQVSGTMLRISESSRIESSSPETITFVQTQPAEFNYHKPSPSFPRMAFMLDAGYNWRTPKISPDLEDFERHITKQLKSGFLWSGSLAYYFKDYYGIGLSFQQFQKSYETYASTDFQSGVYKVKDRITYFGPTFAMQTPLGKIALFNISIGFGYIGYVRKETFANINYTQLGSTLGTQSKAGLSFKISPEWAIGLELISTGGVLYEYTAIDNNGNKEKKKMESGTSEGLAQFGITLGARYYIKSK